MIAVLQQQKVRHTILQVLYISAIAAIIITGVVNAKHNLEAQGIVSSFDFLWKATGWDMTFSLLDTKPTDPYWWFLLMGIVNTLFLGIIGLASATLVGGLVGLARISSNHSARLLGTIYVEIFRNIPLIVQVFFWYAIANRLPSPRQAFEFAGILFSNRGVYIPGFNVEGWAVAAFFLILLAGSFLFLWFIAARRFKRIGEGKRKKFSLVILGGTLVVALLTVIVGHAEGTAFLTLPELKGLNIRGGYRIQPEVYALAFSIAIYGGAYIGEIVRGGFKAVGTGQGEAAQALGLSKWHVFWRIRLPLAIRAMLPILTNQYVWLIKATTLGIVVGFADFFMVIASSITHSGQTLEFIGILMAGFLIINFSLAAVLNRINKAVALKGHQLRS